MDNKTRIDLMLIAAVVLAVVSTEGVTVALWAGLALFVLIYGWAWWPEKGKR